MSTAWRFVRADAASRRLGIIAGNAVGAFLIAAAAALPDALAPARSDFVDWTYYVVAALVTGFIAVPVFMLLVTVGRLSASRRDQRLMALRLLGLNPRRTVAVAAAENALLALAGAALGVAVFALLAPTASAAIAGGSRWFAGTLTAPVLRLAAIAVAVGLFSAVLAASPARRLMAEPKAFAGRTRGPGWWRAVPYAVGVATLVWLPTQPGLMTRTARAWVTAGSVASVVVGLAVVVPLVTAKAATALTKRPEMAIKLAGRGLAAEPSSGTRLVLGLGGAVFLTVAIAGQLWKMEHGDAILTGQRILGDGPQVLELYRAEEIPEAADGLAPPGSTMIAN
ncbi:MAG: hypothetical protein LBU05_02410, partial [Bifidobacteriaceae bacterium]|nr:hypothetical protein [Bifidobacteriaceae bacterium]